MKVTSASASLAPGNFTVGGQILAANGTLSAPGIAFASSPTSGIQCATGGAGRLSFLAGGSQMLYLDQNNNVIAIPAAAKLGWANDGNPSLSSQDLMLVRQAANILAQRNGATAQEQQWYNTYDGTNNEYFSIGWAANLVTLTPVKTGSGTLRAMQIGATTAITLSPTDGGLRINNQTTAATNNLVGTLTNAPVTGNPTFWLPVSIAGSVKYVPCW